MMSKWMKLLAALFAVSLVAAACGSDTASDVADAVDTGDSEELTAAQEALAEAQQQAADAEAAAAEAQAAADAAMAEAGEDDGASAVKVVTVSGPERSEAEAGALNAALEEFGNANGITIVYKGSANWEADINIQLEAGSNPDISIFPQPGKLADFARAGSVLAIPDAVTDAVSPNWSPGAMGFGNVDGTQYGIPNKNDLKSLVWYQPARFEANGYAIPETLDDLWALADTMIADGNTPWCIGIESGQATGWAFTDWVEDMMLRTTTPENYDAWTTGDLPFSSPEVISAMEAVLEQWNKEGAVFAAGGSIATTAFQANGEPLVNGDCMMHRQASFFSSFFPEGTPAADGSEGAVDVFYFPSNTEDKPVLGSGTLAGAFEDRPEVWQVMEYFGSAEYANSRQSNQEALLRGDSEVQVLSGFNTANRNVDTSLWAPLESSFIGIMQNAEILRFDGSDLMPADVGAGTFWSEGTAMVNGDKSVADAAAAIDASWPAG
jgi:alpha-glucoside transport system substrate-binding protein